MAAVASRRRLSDDRGAELVEFAIVLPVLLLLIVGLVDFGLLFRDYEIVTNAAREGARLASLVDYGNTAVEERVRVYAGDAGLDPNRVTPVVVNATITVGPGQDLNGKTVRVTYDHEFTFLGPIASFFGAGFGTVTLTGQSTMRLEAQVAPAGP